jgi:DegV family protein with EDD domain
MSIPCILTDNASFFVQPQFRGKNLLQVLPLDVVYRNTLFSGGKDLKSTDLPLGCQPEDRPELVIPSVSALAALFLDLSQKHSEIICVFHSGSLSPLCERAREAAETIIGHAQIEIIDSQTISSGQGLIVQSTAELFADNHPIAEVARQIRIFINHTFSVFCIPGLSYLHASGFVDIGQAGANELLGLVPIFALEEGRLTPLEKLRSQRQTVDFFQEYMDEFDHMKYIAWVKGVTSTAHESRLLRDHAITNHPHIPFLETPIHTQMAILFGPSASGLFVVESPT